MHLASRVIPWALVAAVCGCAAGMVETEGPANTLRLLSGSDLAAPAAAPTDDAVAAAPESPTDTIRVTVEGPPPEEAAAPPAGPVEPLAEPLPADEWSPSTGEADLAPPEDFLLNEPEAGAVVTDEPATPETAPSTVAGEPLFDAAPASVQGDLVQLVEQPEPPQLPPAAAPMFTQQGEEVFTPRPIPASPFKSGGDESDLDRFNRQISDVPIDIRPTEGEMPTDLAASRMAGEPLINETGPTPSVMPGDIFCTYTPWTICYRPLYFEDIPLERYGNNVGYLQTGLSGVKFYGSILALPYKMTVRRPRSCQCSNGFSRCGDCPLPGYGRREFRLDASIVEAAAVAAAVYILP